MKAGHLASLLLSISLGCAAGQPERSPVGDGPSDSFTVSGGADAFGIADDSAFAIAILRVANEMPVDSLELEVGLVGTSARNIGEYVAGADGARGTPDDKVIASLGMLDSIEYVGPVAFGQLRQYVEARTYGTQDHPNNLARCRYAFELELRAETWGSPDFGGYVGCLAEANAAAVPSIQARQAESDAELASKFPETLAAYRTSFVALCDSMYPAPDGTPPTAEALGCRARVELNIGALMDAWVDWGYWRLAVADARYIESFEPCYRTFDAVALDLTNLPEALSVLAACIDAASIPADDAGLRAAVEATAAPSIAYCDALVAASGHPTGDLSRLYVAECMIDVAVLRGLELARAPILVWAIADSRVYHCPGSRWSGMGEGTTITECDAIAEGYRPVFDRGCGSSCP